MPTILTATARAELLEDEALIIRTSGEIPEVAYHGTLFYLTDDPDGPRLVLTVAELLLMKTAVVERYREIMRRDLEPSNRDKGLYRGLARCMVNWRRLCRYCRQENFEVGRIRAEVAVALRAFLEREVGDIRNNGRISCVNCSAAGLEDFVTDLGIDPTVLPVGWQGICRRQ